MCPINIPYEPLKVIVVDDTTTYRKILSSALGTIPEVTVMDTAANGRIALNKIKTGKPDLILLDMEMPEMNGLELLSILNIEFPDIGVIMISGANAASADKTVKALHLGAFDFIPKPTTNDFENSIKILRSSLISVLKSYEVHRWAKLCFAPKSASAMTLPQSEPAPSAVVPATVNVKPTPLVKKFKIHLKVDVVVIGISTGGPVALNKLIPSLPGNLPVPVLIVQHMPPTFTKSLAESINKKSPLSVQEGYEGAEIRTGNVYIAPGGQHMMVKRSLASNTTVPLIGITNAPPENGCRPSADVLFRSVAEVYDGKALSVVMTGMGSDGTEGVRVLKEYGAYSIAQDEASSLVFGMPDSVIKAGYADETVSLDNIAHRIVQIAFRGLAGIRRK
ncbi:MAG: chemotaxis response regulator protein-glutamate methylesterase [Planctomycetota bacterium]